MATEAELLNTQLKGQISASDKANAASTQKIAAMEQRIDELTAQQNKLDPDDATHADLVDTVNQMQGELSTVKRENAESKAELETERVARKDAETKASEASATVTANEKAAQEAKLTQDGTATVDKWLAELDNEYGKEHHNAAKDAAEAAWAKDDASNLDENGEFLVSPENRAVIIKSLLKAEYAKLRDAKVANDEKGTGEPSLSAPSASGNVESKHESYEDIPDEKFKTRKGAVAALQEQFRREEAAAK